ncbi:MAG: GNAT family N-acetyltransferase [Anaerolineaceae bacterium]|nr:GNAT family N-acetyltransferase [Anaerolineaceae bacterium]
MEITIRPAVVGDAAAIAAVKDAVWPEETSEPGRIARVIACGEHTSFIAEYGGQVVGFVDSFTTYSPMETARWEVDLLAVHPDQQGRGIGRALVSAASQSGHESGATFARALIQTHNTASQRVFARCGYRSDGVARDLYVATRGVAIPQPVFQDTNLIEVRTFNYNGLWVEGHLTIDSLSRALTRLAANSHEYGLAGVLISSCDAALTEAAMSLGYTLVAAFHWWRRDFDD